MVDILAGVFPLFSKFYRIPRGTFFRGCALSRSVALVTTERFNLTCLKVSFKLLRVTRLRMNAPVVSYGYVLFIKRTI